MGKIIGLFLCLFLSNCAVIEYNFKEKTVSRVDATQLIELMVVKDNYKFQYNFGTKVAKVDNFNIKVSYFTENPTYIKIISKNGNISMTIYKNDNFLVVFDKNGDIVTSYE